jgi:hypothetical protein
MAQFCAQRPYLSPYPLRRQLSKNYTKALEQVTKHLEFFPKYLQHRNKQRLTKIHQYMIRMRKIQLKEKCVKSLQYRLSGSHTERSPCLLWWGQAEAGGDQ